MRCAPCALHEALRVQKDRLGIDEAYVLHSAAGIVGHVGDADVGPVTGDGVPCGRAGAGRVEGRRDAICWPAYGVMVACPGQGASWTPNSAAPGLASAATTRLLRRPWEVCSMTLPDLSLVCFLTRAPRIGSAPPAWRRGRRAGTAPSSALSGLLIQ